MVVVLFYNWEERHLTRDFHLSLYDRMHSPSFRWFQNVLESCLQPLLTTENTNKATKDANDRDTAINVTNADTYFPVH